MPDVIGYSSLAILLEDQCIFMRANDKRRVHTNALRYFWTEMAKQVQWFSTIVQ